MNNEDRNKIHILSIVTNNAVGDSRVLKSAESLGGAGYQVTLLAAKIGPVASEEEGSNFVIRRVPLVIKGMVHRVQPLFPFNKILDLSNKYLPRGKRFVRYGCKIFTTDRLFWRWASPLMLRTSPKFLYLCWPLLKDGERSFAKTIDQLRPNIIHANDCDTLGLALRAKHRAAMRGRSISVLYDAHEYVQGVHRKHPTWQIAMTMLERTSINKVNSVMTVSETISGMLEDDYLLTARPVVVLNAPRRVAPPVDPQMETIRKRIGLAPEIPLHVYVGAAAPQRGLDAMVNALKSAVGHHIGLVVNPSNPYVKRLLVNAEKLGVKDRVHVFPYVPEWYVSTFVSDATSGVIPILHHPNHEISLVTKYFEYLHARIPIIVSDVKTMAEEVLLQGNGLVFTAGDSEDLASKFVEIVADHSRFVKAITEPMLDDYSWESQSGKLIAAHDQLAKLI